MKTILTIPTCLLLASGAILADGISLNFASNEPNGTIANTTNTAGAIPVAGANWNNLSGAGGTGVAVAVDNSGAALSGVTVDWSSNNSWRSASPGASATSENGALTKGYLDDGGPGWSMTLNSPYLLNDIYVIHGTDGSGTMAAVSVNGTYYKGDGAGGTILAPAGSADTWAGSPWSNADSLIESDNYIKVLGQAGVSVAADRNGARAALSGVQVEDAYTGTLSFWDIDGTTAGAGGTTPDGNWSDTNWSANAAGTVATALWTPGDAAVFSAGSVATTTAASGSYTVTLGGTESVDAVWVQDGLVTLTGGTLALGTTGLLRGDDPLAIGDGLLIDSTVTGASLTTAGNVTLNSAGNNIAGLVSINGLTTLGADHAFTKLAGGGILDIGATALTLGDATDSTFGGSFEGSGTIDKTGAGTLTLSNPSANFFGTATVSDGTLNFDTGGTLFWDVSGAGDLAKSGGGTLTVTGEISTSGDIDLNGGVLAFGTPLGAPATLDGNTINFNNTNALLRSSTGAPDPLTITNSTLGTASADGRVEAAGNGEIVLGTGTTGAFRELSLANGTATIEAGADLTLRYFNIGNGGGTSGIVNQTGGDVTMEAGSAGFRIGHWSGAGREYNLTGGTLDATAVVANGGENAWANMGWDGEGDMTVGGGAGTATFKASGLRFDRNRGGAGSSASTITILPDGVVETGSLGTQGNGDNDGVVLNGGLLRGVADATWAARMDVASTTATSTIDVGTGLAVTQSNVLFGSGDLDKTGGGTLVLNNGGNTHDGTITVTDGTLKVNGATFSTVSVGSGGTIGAGLSGSAGTGSVDFLSLESGSSSNFRIGGTTDDQVSVFQVDGLSVTASHTITVTPIGSVAINDQFPVIDYDGTIGGDGFGGLSLAAFPNPHYALSLFDDTTATSVVVTVDDIIEGTWTMTTDTIWNLATTNWDYSGASALDQLFVDADIVNFNDLDPAESVVVDASGGAITPALMKFNNTTATTYTISGDAISGPGGILKTGDGTVIFDNDNTFTGPIDIQAGILQVGDGGTTTGSLGAGDLITVAAGAQFIVDRADASTLPRGVTGDGVFIKNGAGDLTATGGGGAAEIIINEGILLARGGQWTVSFADGKPITVNAGATLDTVTHSLGGLGVFGIIPSEINLVGGTWQLNNEQYASSLNMTAGLTTGAGEVRTYAGLGGTFTVNADPSPSVMAARLNMFGAKTIEVADGAADPDLLISGPIVGGAGLTKSGPGRLLSTGTNTSTGPVFIPEGRFALTGDNSGRTGGYEVTGGILEATSIADAGIGTGYIALKNGTLEYLGTGIESTSRILWIDAAGQSGTFNIVNAGAVVTMTPSGGNVNQDVIKDGAGRLVLNGPIGGGASVTVNAGRLDLNGANTYTGNTTVETGATLVMGLPTFDDSSSVLIYGTGKINLSHGANDVIGELLFDGAAQASGTWGATGSGAANIDDARFIGTGTLEVVSASDYDTWATGFGLDPLGNGAPGEDADGDGLTNGGEYAFGLDPTDASSLNPIYAGLDQSTGTFSYNRRDPALTGYTYSYESSTTLTAGGWTAFTPDAEVPSGSPGQTVDVTVPAALLTNPVLFVRVVATP